MILLCSDKGCVNYHGIIIMENNRDDMNTDQPNIVVSSARQSISFTFYSAGQINTWEFNAVH